jgi:hypothetical protein
MTVFYDAPLLCSVFRYLADRATFEKPLQDQNDPNVLRKNDRIRRKNDERRRNLVPLAFADFGLDDAGIRLAPLLARNLRRAFVNDEKDLPPFTLTEVAAAVSPSVFAAILTDSALSDLGLDRVQLVDEYVRGRPKLCSAHREAFTAVASWEEAFAHLHLVRHSCDWLPARFARPLLCKLLNIRCGTAAAMEGDLRSAASRWHVFAWLQTLVDAKLARTAPQLMLSSSCRHSEEQQHPLIPRCTGS